MTVINYKARYENTKPSRLGYQLFLPDTYEDEREKQWPLIVFLHGIKRRGDDLSLLDGYGLIPIAESLEDFNFIVAAPQCPAHSDWPKKRDALMELLDNILVDNRVDIQRIYLIGFSMGGNGVWDLAAYHPERFAAAAPLAGWFQPQVAHLLKDIPIWTFHGEEDDIIPVTCTEEMVAALRNEGANISCTLYPGLQHSIMEETLSNAELYEWLLQHKR